MQKRHFVKSDLHLPLSVHGQEPLDKPSAVDVVLIDGDAFVDHPSFGTAVIARWLEAAGFSVAVISQPDWKNENALKVFGCPRLFFGISAGNVDSMVANYTAALNKRVKDEYSPNGKAGLRPDRAVIVYANMVRRAYKDCLLVIGGIEASLRRFAHYDWWSDSVRRSILLDSRADLLVWGMGEQAVEETARRIKEKASLAGISGTVCFSSSEDAAENAVRLPSYEEAAAEKYAFAKTHAILEEQGRAGFFRPVVQPSGSGVIVQYPASMKKTCQMDRAQELPYSYEIHPEYKRIYGENVSLPAFDMVKDSITSHRGCFGGCAFCAIFAHQGKEVFSRSRESILRQARGLASKAWFKGHVRDVGGPTANMYGASCKRQDRSKPCGRDCLFPSRCKNLESGHREYLRLLGDVARVDGIKKVSVGSGIRYDLLEDEPRDIFNTLCSRYVSGQIRVAPEHITPLVLSLMRKPSVETYRVFRRRYKELQQKKGQKRYVIPYYISGHPGTTIEDMMDLAEFIIKEEKISIESVQDFMPAPMTASACMYHTGLDPFTMGKVHVPKGAEKRLQRAILQLGTTGNYDYAVKVLKSLKREDLLPRLKQIKQRIVHSK